ncbi:MAG: winged helix-turn-helix domain-containing protein [Methanotrichaceae archaeon]
MSKRRNTNVVTSQILKICREGASKTKVIYRANLNSVIGNRYLDNLTRNGFVEAITDGSRTIYKTTSKGLDLQEKLGQFQVVMDHLYSDA